MIWLWEQKECAQAKPELKVKKAALRIKLKEVQELNIVCEPKIFDQTT
jgi:hypothetical protein